MFGDKFKNELDPICATDKLLAKTRQRIRDEIKAPMPSHKKPPRRNIIAASLAAALLMTFFVGTVTWWLSSYLSQDDMGPMLTASKGDTPDINADNLADAGLHQFDSHDAIVAFLNENKTADRPDIFDEVWNDREISMEAERGETSPEMADAANEQQEDYSKTNIQVEGVDEADLIKTDGRYIYYLTDGLLFIVDAKNPTALVLTVYIDPRNAAYTPDGLAGEPNFTEFYYDEARESLMVVASMSSYGIYYYNEAERITDDEDVVGRIWSSIRSGDVMSDSIYRPSFDNAMTWVLTYDVSDRTTPKLISTFFQDGYYLTSRRIGDVVYLMTSYYSYSYYGYDKAMLPSSGTRITDAQTIEASDIYIGDPFYADTTLVISAVQPYDEKSQVQTKALIGYQPLVYFSLDTLFLTSTAPTSSKGLDIDKLGYWHTSVLALDVDGLKMVPKASTTIPGTVLNRYSMNQYQNNFRVATTISTQETTKNAVFVLDDKLKPLGSLTNLAPTERIYSAQFDRDRIYLVTFKEIDPFFVIDASDPQNLKVLGELKIPGYSDYLHIMGDNTVLGIGRTTIESEWGGVVPAALKLSVFDVTDPQSPVEKNPEVYGTTSGWSEVLYNPRALLVDKQRGIIGLPVTFDRPIGTYGGEYITGYAVLSIDNTKNLSHEHLFEHDGMSIIRGVLIGENLYLGSQRALLSYRLSDGKKLDQVDLIREGAAGFYTID